MSAPNLPNVSAFPARPFAPPPAHALLLSRACWATRLPLPIHLRFKVVSGVLTSERPPEVVQSGG
eukprot:1652576-Rhodomonas_salina.1